MNFDLRVLFAELGTTFTFYLLHLFLLHNASESWNKALIPTPYTLFIIIILLIMIVQIIRKFVFNSDVLIEIYYISFAISILFGLVMYNNLWKKFH